MTTKQLEAQVSDPGREENLRTYDEIDDELTEDVARAVDQLHERGLSFVKAKRVAKALDLEASKQTHMDVGQRLVALSKREPAIVEKWGPGDGHATWRIVPPEDR